MATAAMPGATRGRTILTNICHSVAPSILAESSISSGSPWKKLIMYQIMKVMLIRIQARMTGAIVLRIPVLANMMYSGIVKATGGRIRISMTQKESGLLRAN